MNIVVLTGGLSMERDVAISSGGKIAKALRSKGHNVVFMDVYLGYEGDKTPAELFSENSDLIKSKSVAEDIPDIEAVKAMRSDRGDCFLGKSVMAICRYADITFFALHGGEGENGQLQAAFDILGIKYTGTDYLSAALAMDKGISRALFEQRGVRIAKGKKYFNSDSTGSWDIFPCIIKPCAGGSSVGLTKVDTREQFDAAVKEAFLYDDEIVVEQFIDGREFAVGVLGNEVLPPIEIIPTTGFYDYKSKYQAGLTIEECPARITEAEDKALRDSAYAAYQTLGLKSYARMDFILDKDGKTYCLEANALPGMTPTSLLPQEAEAAGIDFAALCDRIVEISLEKYK
ncbi:MAG: D-alanine--D-alanine ligase [Ruminococcus sp.]|nr:D-alanine--D-alanine ligase [Ruminococcus sp.]